MILPTKHIRPDRALIGVGSDILSLLHTPKTVSGLWSEFDRLRQTTEGLKPVSFDWFILGLDFLYMIDAVEYRRGLLNKKKRTTE